MFANKLIATGVAVALGLCGTLAGAATVVRNDAVELVGAGAVADPLIAVEANRAAIINRLAVRFGEAATQAGVNAETFRGVLSGLRADQLLAAALVGSFAELTAIVTQPPSDGAMLQRYVALTPTIPQSFSELPFAQAYLTRDFDTLTVTRAQDLRLGETSVVGYFAASGTVVSSSAVITPKDGPGIGANSWIGYVAGSNLASGPGSAVAAGTFNAATGQGSFVGAGSSNVASGISSLVIGGFDNRATAIDSLVGSGAGNRATGARSIVVGGGYNLASGQFSFLGGGGRDGVASTPAGTDAKDNIAGGNFSVVTGGQGNRAPGAFAAVPGGNSNLASGSTSVALGNRAKTQSAGAVIHDGTFAFADGNAFDFNTAANNEFAVRATGGMRVVTGVDGSGVPTKTTTLDGGGNLSVPGNVTVGGTLSASGLGSVTSLSQGTGITLSVNPITTSGSITADTTYLQRRVSGTCTAGNSIRTINADGSVLCEADDVGVGSVTSLSQGNGITLSTNPITTNGSITADTTYLQRRVSSTCAVGTSIRAIAVDGSVTCQTDSTGPANAFVQNGNAFGATAILGTTDIKALDLQVNGSRVMRYEPNATSPNIVGGHPNNAVVLSDYGQTISGGGQAGNNCYDPGTDTYSRSCKNNTSHFFATIGGGVGNTASFVATVGGGESNVANALHATVAGGFANLALGNSATVGGGHHNLAGDNYVTVAGGQNNIADNIVATVGGGQNNAAGGSAATVAGGINNISSGANATVAGGNGNTASGDFSTIGGGNPNIASGLYSTVGGGNLNTASGNYSFAAGRRSKAVSPGCFTWADSNDFDFTCGLDNAFSVRATGGVYIVTGINGTGDQTSGVFVGAGGGAWSTLSDRAAKQDIVPINGLAVLAKLAVMPIYTWRYKAELSGALHLGPVAQDFSAAFGLGNDDKTISTVDADGVALAAIQGLNAKLEAIVEAQARELDKERVAREVQAREIAELKRAVEVLLARTTSEGRMAAR